jgi:hypothetical protein
LIAEIALSRLRAGAAAYNKVNWAAFTAKVDFFICVDCRRARFLALRPSPSRTLGKIMAWQPW